MHGPGQHCVRVRSGPAWLRPLDARLDNLNRYEAGAKASRSARGGFFCGIIGRVGELIGVLMASSVLAVGDPSRESTRRALVWCLACSALFTVFAFWTTQDKPLRAHSP